MVPSVASRSLRSVRHPAVQGSQLSVPLARSQSLASWRLYVRDLSVYCSSTLRRKIKVCIFFALKIRRFSYVVKCLTLKPKERIYVKIILEAYPLKHLRAALIWAFIPDLNFSVKGNAMRCSGRYCNGASNPVFRVKKKSEPWLSK